jgi:hypothetical protein
MQPERYHLVDDAGELERTVPAARPWRRLARTVRPLAGQVAAAFVEGFAQYAIAINPEWRWQSTAEDDGSGQD